MDRFHILRPIHNNTFLEKVLSKTLKKKSIEKVFAILFYKKNIYIMSDFNIFDTLIKLMEDVECSHLDDNGELKKTLVLLEIAKILGKETYERYESYIDMSIDFLTLVSKKKVRMKINRKMHFFKKSAIKNIECCKKKF